MSELVMGFVATAELAHTKAADAVHTKAADVVTEVQEEDE